MPQKNDDRQGCVLIARFSAIGDVAMTIPVVYNLCRSYPHRQFVFLTKPFLAPIFVDRPQNLSIETIDTKGRHKGFAGLYRLSRQLSAKWKIEAFADLHDVLRTKVLRSLFRLQGIPVAAIDKGRSEKRRLVKLGAINYHPLKPQIERYADVFRTLGLSLEKSFDGLWGGHAKAPGEHPLKPYIVIAPFAAHAGKIYPAERMEQVISALSAREIPVVILGGGGDEERLASDWAARYGGVTSLAGKRLGFARELEIINHAAVTIAMDSGNMHLSAIACTPTVSVWGATHPYCGFAPWKQSEGIIQAQMPCRPCSVFGNKPCRLASTPRCMDAIDPQVIVDKVLSYL